MPEPDFDQIAQNAGREILHVEPGDTVYAKRDGIAAIIAEQLRQVWNARGAEDFKLLTESRDYEIANHPSRGPYYASFIDSIKKLDR